MEPAKPDLSEQISFLPLVSKLLEQVEGSAKKQELVDGVKELHDKFENTKLLLQSGLPGLKKSEEEQQEELKRLEMRIQQQRTFISAYRQLPLFQQQSDQPQKMDLS